MTGGPFDQFASFGRSNPRSPPPPRVSDLVPLTEPVLVEGRDGGDYRYYLATTVVAGRAVVVAVREPPGLGTPREVTVLDD